MADPKANAGLGNRTDGRQLARARALYVEGIAQGRPKEAVEAYTGDRYIQHSTGVKDGREGFIEFFADFVDRNPERHIEIVRGWEDGRYVFLHAYQSLNGGEYEYVTTDFFDTDNDGKIIEHWDVIGQFTGANPSGRTQVDGATDITDLDRTEENKAIVRAMLKHCLFPGARPERIEDYFAEDYLQHNPNVGDGLDVVRQLAQGQNRQLTYDEIVLTVGRGNFVATLCKANWEGKPLAQVDIVRLDDGKIIEHWDNVEPVPATNVNSGKF
ncbi:MAG: nuclear transport factor 2 family protein [Acidimicrobiales bacterium]